MTRSMFVACALAVPSIVQAQANQTLTLDQALELAARQNPEVVVARAREVEARGRLATASVRFVNNPDLDLFLGSRQQSVGGSTPEVDFNVLQRLEIAGQRGPRIESATAQITQRSADIDMAALTARAATARRSSSSTTSPESNPPSPPIRRLRPFGSDTGSEPASKIRQLLTVC